MLYENGRVPDIIRNQSMDADTDVPTTRASLESMQKRGETTAPHQVPGRAFGTGLPRPARRRTHA
ncbi:hypothetical protein MHZ93_14535 [Roseomonas sp. ACRSG]|jgi:hypothetical protein|nr:hypothetical protein [Roseomonas sp. ACRSG]